MRGSILLSFLAVASSASASAVGPEITLDGGSIHLPWYGFSAPSVACGSENCLVVRTDNDSARGPGVVFTRVDSRTGTLLDPGERWIAPGMLLDVACVGDDCTVASMITNPAVMPIGRLRLAHVSASSGVISGTTSPDVAASWGLNPTGIACGTSTCLTVWLEGTNTGAMTVRAARVDPVTALPLGAGGFTVSPPSENLPPVVGCDGSRCVVAWTTNGGYVARFRRVDLTTGAVIDPADLDLGATGLFAPLISCSSGLCAAAWSDFVPPNSRLLARRIRLDDATTLDPVPLSLEISPMPLGAESIACLADLCTIGWNALSPHRAMATRWNITTGAVLDPAGVVLSDESTAIVASVGCSGTRCLVAWDDSRGGTDQETFATRFDAATALAADPFGLAIGTNAMVPAPACVGSRCVVTWQQTDEFPGAGGYTVYGAAVDATTALATSSRPVQLVGVGWRNHPSFTCGGTGTCLLGTDLSWDHQVAIERVDSMTAARLDSVPVPLTAAGSNPARTSVACLDATCLAAWQAPSAAGDLDLFGARVDLATGAMVGVSFAIDAAPGDQALPTVACASSRCAVAWQDARSGDWNLSGTRVDMSTGARIDTTDVAVSTAPGDQTTPRFACDGGNCLLVWQDTRDLNDEDVYAARWNLSGAVINDMDGIAVATGPTRQQRPALSCAGGRCLLAWQDLGAGVSNVLGARIDLATGALIDVPSVALVPDHTGARGPSVVSWDLDRAIVTYYRRDDMTGLHVLARTVTSNLGAGAACADGIDCVSGSCVAHICGVSPFPPGDAGTRDAGLHDAGAPDVGGVSADAAEADVLDASATPGDASMSEAGTIDANVPRRVSSRSCACGIMSQKSGESCAWRFGLAIVAGIAITRRRTRS